MEEELVINACLKILTCEKCAKPMPHAEVASEPEETKRQPITPGHFQLCYTCDVRCRLCRHVGKVLFTANHFDDDNKSTYTPVAAVFVTKKPTVTPVTVKPVK